MSDRHYALLRLDVTGGVVGAALGAASALAWGLDGHWGLGAIVAVLFLLGGAVRLQPKYPLTRFALTGVWALVCIILSGAIPTVMVAKTSYLAIGAYRVAMNFLCVAVAYGVCLAAAGDIRRAVTAASALLLLMATADAILYTLRGAELQAQDLLSWGAALAAADWHTFRLTLGMARGWLAWGLAMFWLWRLPKVDLRLPRGVLRGGAAIAVCLCLVLTVYGIRDIPARGRGNEASTRNGFFLNFSTGIRDACGTHAVRGDDSPWATDLEG